MRLRAIVALALSLVSVRSVLSQTSGPGEIRGKLVDSASHQAVDAGSISVLRARDSVVAEEARSGPDGSFHVEHLALGRYIVRLRSLGFLPVVRTNIDVTRDRLSVDLGTIALSAVAAQIAGQVVTTERADVTVTPDRNSYATKNMTAATGGTAVDVLRNVPSVEVDATNQVSLRGNQGVVVQINGRPSPLRGEQLGNFLAQLPASAVKNVEVSTNPSAKNDPEGTAGIINIVLNEEPSLGWSGGWTAATGTTGQANASANVGHQGGPLTLFLSYGVYRNHMDTDGHAQLRNLQATSPALITSRIDGTLEPLWQNSTFRGEYRVAPHDAVSLDATVSGGTFMRDNVSYSADLDPTGSVIGLFNQSNDQHTKYVTQDYALAYRHTGEATDRAFSTEGRYTTTSGTINTMLSGDVESGSAATGASDTPTERDLSTAALPSWSLQTDYTEPFGGKSGTKLETGLKATQGHTNNDFSAAYLDSASGIFVPAVARGTAFDYREQVSAAYALVTQQIAKLRAQAGLRVEEATTRLSLAGSRIDNDYASAFPSAILSYDFTKTRQAKLSYARRITRPNPFQLDPVDYRVDARTLFRGNSSLRPEYTDALEAGWQETRGWGSIQLNPYLRHTAHAVRTIQFVDSSGTTINTYANVASTRELGADVNSTVHGGPVTLVLGGNASHYQSDATNLAGNPSTRAFVWSTRINATWQANHTVDAQLGTNYRSAFATEGGSRKAFVFMNASVRKKLWNDQGSITLRVQDPFNLLTIGSVTSTPQAVQSSVQSFGIRGVFIAVSRNFGQELKLRPPEQPDPTTPTPPPGAERR